MADPKTEDKQKATMELAEPQSVAELYVDDLLIALHGKALESVKSFADFTIQNSAIEGDGKNATFYGAGSHVVAAIPKDSNKNPTIPKTTAFEMLKTYIQWFSGPDVAKKLTIDKLSELNPDENKNESIIPSFAQYLVLEDGEAPSDDSTETSGEKPSEEAGSDEKDETKEKEKNKEDAKEEKGKGYFVSYKIQIAGQKEHPLINALKKLGKDLLKGFGVKLGSWRSGTGEAHTIGGLIDELDNVFGKIDPDQLKANFDKNIKAKLPQTSVMSELFDQATIVRMLKNKLDGKEKSKIKTADYSFCVKVARNDKSRKIANVQLIADVLTKSIQGIFKKFKNSISKKDVILVNDYDENDKSKDKANRNLKQDTNDESLKKPIGNLIAEDENSTLTEDDSSKKSVEDVLKEMQEYLQKAVDGKFSDTKKHEASIKPSNEIVDYISKVSETDEKVFNTIKKHKHAFMVEIEAKKPKEGKDTKDEEPKKEEPKESISILHASNDMLRLLFEAIDSSDPNKAAIEKIFSNLANNAKFLEARGKKEPEENEIFAFNVEATKNESISNTKNLYNMLFEDASAQKTLRTLIYESSNYGKGVGRNIIKNKGAKNLLANIDKMVAYVKTNYKTKKGEKKEDSIRYKTLELIDKFKDCKTDEDMQKFIDDNFMDGGKDTEDDRIRTAFIKSMDIEGIPDKDEEEDSGKIKITFKDIDDPSQLSDPTNISDDDKEKYKQIDDPIEVEPGKDVKTPEIKDKDGFKFDHFEPDPKSMKEDGDTFAIYKKGDETEDNNDNCKIKLFDADPESGEKTGDPIAEFDVPKGEAFNSTDDGKKAFEDADKQLEDNKKDGFTFKGWNKDASEKAEEDTELVAKYLADDDKDKEFTVVFQYPPDPSKEDDVEEVPGDLGTQKIKAGESAKEPDPPEIEGWKFKKWSDDTSNVTDDMMVLAEYQKPTRFIFKAPKDPEKPEDDLQPIGDPIEAEDGKAPEPPTPPEFDDYEFDKWNPDPTTLKDPEGDQEIVATYKKKEPEDNGDEDDSGDTLHTIYVLPDYAGVLDEDEVQTVTITFTAPELDEKDPSKTDLTKTTPIGDPQKVEKDKPIDVGEDGTLKQGDKELAKPRDLTKGGFVFDKWDPDPSKGFSEDKDVVAQYKEDANKKAASKNLKGEGYDFYIVPMKGIKPKDTDDEPQTK